MEVYAISKELSTHYMLLVSILDVKSTSLSLKKESKKLVKIDDKAITTEEVIDAVCKQFDVSSAAIGSRSRKHDFVVARQVAM